LDPRDVDGERREDEFEQDAPEQEVVGGEADGLE
jgi:hypothetical protein